MVYDLTNARSLEPAQHWVEAARAQTHFTRPVVMMLGNKSDRTHERKVHFFRAQEVSSKLGLPPFDVTQVSPLYDFNDVIYTFALRNAINYDILPCK